MIRTWRKPTQKIRKVSSGYLRRPLFKTPSFSQLYDDAKLIESKFLLPLFKSLQRNYISTTDDN